MKHRMLSLLLAVVMVLALLPGEVWAADPTASSEVEYPVAGGIILFKDGVITGYKGNNITGVVAIPEQIGGASVTSIKDNAFTGTGITKVTIPSGVTSIGKAAFAGCTALSEVFIPNTVTFIGDDAFSTTGLRSAVLPASVTTVGARAFASCSQLETAIIIGPQKAGTGATQTTASIGASAFVGCGKLTTVYLGEFATGVNSNAFNNTPLKIVHYGGTYAEIKADTVGTNFHAYWVTQNKKSIHYRDDTSMIPTPAKAVSCKESDPDVQEIYTIFCSKEGCEKIPVIKRTVPKLQHTAETVTKQTATCIKPGSAEDYQKCSVCGKLLTTAEVEDPLGHDLPDIPEDINFDDLTSVNATDGLKIEIKAGDEPTCEKEGVATVTRTCQRNPCDNGVDEDGDANPAYEEVTTLPVPAKGHTWEDLTDTDEGYLIEERPGSCKEGEESPKVSRFGRKCATCGAVETPDPTELEKEIEAVIYAYEHDGASPSDGVEVEATGSGDRYYCQIVVERDANDQPVYGRSYEAVPVEHTAQEKSGDFEYEYEYPEGTENRIEGDTYKKEHYEFKDWVPGGGNCVDGGLAEVYLLCQTCGGPIKQDSTGAVVTPTTTLISKEDAQGNHSFIKEDDGKTDKIEFDPDPDKEEKAATCGAAGLGHKTCELCGAVEQVEIPATGEHEFEEGDKTEIPATCTEPKKIVITGVCTVCGTEVDEEKTEGSPLGHLIPAPDLANAKVIKPATCKEEGSQIVNTVCQREGCGEELQNTVMAIPKLAHDFGAWTTGSDGVRTRTCKVCGEEQKDGSNASTETPGKPSDPDGSGGTTTKPKTYNIHVVRPSNGAISAGSSTATSGTSVTLTFTPNAGYELDMVRVERSSGGRVVTATRTGNNRYVFTMPAANVEVRATFTAIPGYTSSSGSGSTAPSKRNQVTNVIQSAPQASASSQIYGDIPTSHWAAGEIAWVTQRGLMSGSGNRFNPDSGVNQQQLWMVLARMMGQNPANMDAARRWATTSGFAEGGNPAAVLTRQQLVKALYRVARLLGSTNNSIANLGGYSDSRNVAAGARDAMAWAVANGIISGTSDGKLNPNGTVTRAHFAVILYRFYQRAF